MTTPLKVAAVQFEPTMFEKERNVARLLELVHEAAGAGARLIVTPEMGTTGYCWFDRAEVAPFVEPIPGPTTDRFAAAARALGVHIVIGMPEVDPQTNLYYNAAVLIGPEGIVGTHRKTHPYIAEPKWATPGDLGHKVFDTPVGRIALLVCMDIHFVETARLAGLQGADIICHISNWLAERTPAPYWITRAMENGCYLIESNRWGLERTVQFSGGSCVIGPDGAIEAVIDSGDGIALADIDLERARARRVLGEEVFAQRRPELYMELPIGTHAWNPLDFFGLYGHRPLPPGRRSRVAVAQFAPAGDVAANLARIEELAARAAREEGAELVVFPERALTGLDAPAAVLIDGEAVAGLLAIAARHGVHLVAGLAESEGGTLYNSAVLVGPQGVIGRYRKTHLDATDHNWATPGDDWGVFDTRFGRIGMLIGHDAAFPEAGRVQALRGCDLIVCPAALRGSFTAPHAGSQVAQNYPIPTGADPHHWHLMRARAGENNVFLAFANVLDEAAGYAGKSGVFGPDTFEFPRREVILGAGEGVVATEIDTTNLDTRYPTNVVRRKDLVVMRLPHHYQPLVR
ncbi:nitrilase-related carbon-nitrogen hydrolase [Ancylobacter sp. TS-1]|uniref:nitrilase-related carbon-nitrogen hydrolase n=1 Tax=Ancylobacter sp. TS-1 TaxID=1850374 RepID=UPI001265C04B|nr:nitrilase-related carbon-nitrogen hydrolase [Ancylobacter sp. TS-1]QFR34168.1 amidohydrolase [Ancylobacter sp. TS-1]